MRPREIGLDPAKLPAAAILFAVIWAMNQVILVIVFVLTNHEIVLNSNWTDARRSWAAGEWIGQLFGNTLLEEVTFRGFLLPQCMLLVLSRMPTARPGMQITLALVLSQGLFTLPHVYFNMHQPEGQWLLLVQFVMGLAFAGVYIRTGNLFLAMGVHTLANNPGPLLKEPFDGTALGGSIIMLGTLLTVVFGPQVVKVATLGEPGRTSRCSRPGPLTVFHGTMSLGGPGC